MIWLINMTPTKTYIEKYNDVLELLKSSKYKKNNDYNSKQISRFDYCLFGKFSLIDKIWMKVLRLLNLTMFSDKIYNESIQDTLLDLANYSIDLHIYIGENGDKDEGKNRGDIKKRKYLDAIAKN